jgi:hypothetical protein
MVFSYPFLLFLLYVSHLFASDFFSSDQRNMPSNKPVFFICMYHLTFGVLSLSGQVVKPDPLLLMRACLLLKCAWPVLKPHLAGA